MNKELERLEQLRQNKSIDQITFQRLKHLLEHACEQKREETIEEYASLQDEELPKNHAPTQNSN